MKIDIQPYNPDWPAQFQTLKADLERLLPPTTYTSIEHVGSTAVPDLPAKPVLDIDIVLPAAPATQDPAAAHAALDAVVRPLVAGAGYTYRGEQGIPGRHALAAPRDAVPRRNLYVCAAGCAALRNHVAVRDTCRRDPRARERYAALKRELAAREFAGVDEYVAAKSDVLGWILGLAGMSEGEISAIRDLNEVAIAQRDEESN